MFLVEDFINLEDYPDVYYAYVRFFMNLYGTHRDDAKEAIKQVNDEKELKVLALYNEQRELIAIARFKVLGNEQLTSDIITIKEESDEREAMIYRSMINRLEEEAMAQNLDLSFLEIPKFDLALGLAAQNLGYSLEPGSESDKKSKYVRTLLMYKDLKKLESEQVYGRYRINKQTSKSDK